MGALLVQFLSLMAGVAAITTLLLAYRAERRLLSLRYGFFLFSLWLITLSFLLHRLELLTGRVELFLAATVVSGLGSLTYIFVAPPFYHAVLGKPLTKRYRYGYALLDLLVLFGVLGLAWQRYRGVAITVLHALLFALVLYGILLIALRYRALAEKSLRRAVGTFVFLSLLFFPPMYIESAPAYLAPFVHPHWFDGVALPLFVLSVSVLSIPFVLNRVYRPAYADASGPTEFFLKEYSLSPREGEVVACVARGMSNREIGEALFISEKTVETHLGRIYQKTGVSGRLRLTNLLLANR